jgi:hypothetical protein
MLWDTLPRMQSTRNTSAMGGRQGNTRDEKNKPLHISDNSELLLLVKSTPRSTLPSSETMAWAGIMAPSASTMPGLRLKVFRHAMTAWWLRTTRRERMEAMTTQSRVDFTDSTARSLLETWKTKRGPPLTFQRLVHGESLWTRYDST